MNPEGQDDCHVGDPPVLLGYSNTHDTFSSPIFHNRGEIPPARFLDQEHASPALPLFAVVQNCSRFGASLRILSTSSSPSTVAWGQLCVPFTNERSRTRQKSNARSCRAMHVCADRSLAWLVRRCGLSKLLKRWLPSLAARFAPPPMRYPANENHPRSRSSLSSTKSLQSAPRRRAF